MRNWSVSSVKVDIKFNKVSSSFYIFSNSCFHHHCWTNFLSQTDEIYIYIFFKQIKFVILTYHIFLVGLIEFAVVHYYYFF